MADQPANGKYPILAVITAVTGDGAGGVAVVHRSHISANEAADCGVDSSWAAVVHFHINQAQISHCAVGGDAAEQAGSVRVRLVDEQVGNRMSIAVKSGSVRIGAAADGRPTLAFGVGCAVGVGVKVQVFSQFVPGAAG